MKFIFPLFLVIVLLLSTGISRAHTEYFSHPAIRQLWHDDPTTLYELFIRHLPELDGITTGNENAPLILIAYLDNSEASNTFTEEIKPALQSHIDDNMLLLIEKPLLSLETAETENLDLYCGNCVQEALEAHSFGLRGISPKLHLSIRGADSVIMEGLPQTEELMRTIRYYRTQVGG